MVRIRSVCSFIAPSRFLLIHFVWTMNILILFSRRLALLAIVSLVYLEVLAESVVHTELLDPCTSSVSSSGNLRIECTVSWPPVQAQSAAQETRESNTSNCIHRTVNQPQVQTKMLLRVYKIKLCFQILRQFSVSVIIIQSGESGSYIEESWKFFVYNKPLEATDQMASNGESGFYIEESGYVCIPLKLLIRWLIRWHHLEA